MMDAPNDDATTKFVFLATDPSLHVICLSRAEVIQVIESPSLSTTLNDLLVENILKKTKCKIY